MWSDTGGCVPYSYPGSAEAHSGSVNARADTSTGIDHWPETGGEIP